MKHLLLFSIGPVQSFIAQARKTHDLYAGSQLLSDLVKGAITVIGTANLIFPKIGDAMPNRFLALIPDDRKDYVVFGNEIEKAVRDNWKKIANDIINDDHCAKPSGFDEQIENLLEIYWIIGSYNDNKDYKSILSDMERDLSALKNIRSFSQFTWQGGLIGEQGRKCSLDGQRNVQFYRPYAGKTMTELGRPLYSSTGSVYISSGFANEILQPGEGLSAVSYLKRRYKHQEIESFKSTVEIALLDALNDLNKDTCGSIYLQEYKRQLFSSFNAQLFYEDSLTDNFLSKQGIALKNNLDLTKIQKKRKALQDVTKYKFQKYYAVLIFDGDNMGKWWTGEQLNDPTQLMDFQMKLAQQLSLFAKEAKGRLNNTSGATVYAGGDDFLGFVNLNHLLPLLIDLRILFEKIVNIPLSEFKKEKISFSAGVCVAHYKEPLTLVLQEVRKAEEKAKELEGKDGFTISVIKGSGENHTTSLSFGLKAINVRKMNWITDSLIKEEFSNSFIKNLRIEFEGLIDFSEPIFEVENMFHSELIRLLKRSAQPAVKTEKVIKTSSRLMDLCGAQSINNFLELLSIIDFFQRELDKP